MRVVIVTGQRPHHKNLCVKLARTQDVVGIIHPAMEVSSFRNVFRKWLRQTKKNGIPLMLLAALRRLPAGGGSGAAKPDFPVADAPDFKRAEQDYAALAQDLIHVSCDVHSPETHALLRSLRADVAVCLGGPIYPRQFIECCPLMLNFHSGVSPFYNGTSSIQFAFANGHLRLCGGTLMVISAGVDSGGIIGHFLPAIQSGDTPETLFQKTVSGAVGMYERLLESLGKQPRPLTPISQPRPLFYTLGIELGWHSKVMIGRQRRLNLAARSVRPERAVEYWRATDAAAASELYRETIDELLWRTDPVSPA
jgi:folate-dependent phosphoribosylglycinamide formyltransferase PurN